MWSLLGALGSFALWCLRWFKPKSDAERAGALTAQKAEVANVLKRTVDAERMRDLVQRLNADELRNDDGNLYRD